ncbi:hypothetical protein CFE70_010498 [Pyrenophora teres f. teres 0-1]
MPLSSDANSNNACAVFGSLPLDALSQILKNLPNLVFDALREWVFVAAAQAGQKLPKAMTSNLTSWIQAGLLVHCIENLATESSIALRYVFESFEKDITPRDLNLRSALLSAMEAGVWWNKSAAPVNLEAFYILGYVFNDYLLFPTGLSVQKNAAREFCEKEDWDSAASFVVIVDPEVHSKSIEEYEVQAKRWKEAKKAIEEAIMEKNLEKAWGYLKQCSDPGIWNEYASNITERDTSHSVSQISIGIIREMEDRGYGIQTQFLTLIEGGHIATVGALLQEESQWCLALETAKSRQDFWTLEFFIFQRTKIPYVDYVLLHDGRQQFCLRILAFYAMTMNGYFNLVWTPVSSSMMHDDTLRKVPVWYNGFRKDESVACNFMVFPSLLAVAAERNPREWISFLLIEGNRTADSMALLRTVNFKAEIATICLLLNASQSKGFSTQHNYGSAATRQAILDRDPKMIKILCGSVKIDSIELSTEEYLAIQSEKPISALGQAIKMQEYQMVETLLKNGASPNACVLTSGLQLPGQDDS